MKLLLKFKKLIFLKEDVELFHLIEQNDCQLNERRKECISTQKNVLRRNNFH